MKMRRLSFFVFKHAARWARTEQPTGPQLNPEAALSHGREENIKPLFS